MQARTNLTGAVLGSLVIFDNGYQGKVIIVEEARVKISVPLRSGNGVRLNLWLDKNTGKEYGFFASRKELDEANKEFFKKMKAYNKAVADYDRTVTTLVKLESAKLEVKDFTIQKVEKRKYVVCVDLPTGKTTVDKTFKSITAANEFCALHLKTI